MSAKHTPGPWVVRQSSCGSVGTDSMLIALTYGDDPDCKADDRMRANARLIAAAPELLEALRVARDCVSTDRQALADSHTGPDGLDEDGAAGVAEYDRALAVIDSAIAKAEGGA